MDTFYRSTIRGLDPGPNTPQDPHLLMLNGSRYLEAVPLATSQTRIGRHPGNDLALPSTRVSSRHCRIYWDRDCFMLEDRGSLNGTQVNGRRAEPEVPVPLTNGDKIEIADQVMLFLWPEAEKNTCAALSVRIDKDKVTEEVDRIMSELPGLRSQRRSGQTHFADETDR